MAEVQAAPPTPLPEAKPPSTSSAKEAAAKATPASAKETKEAPKETPKAAAEAPAPTPAQVRQMKLALGDKAFELPEEEVIALASANGKALYEAKKAERELEELKAKLKDKWRDVLKEQGVDVKEAILSEFAKELEAQADETDKPPASAAQAVKDAWEKLPAEVRQELWKREKEANARAEAEKAAKAKEAEAAHNAKKEEAKARLRATIDEAIKVGGLSNSNFVRGVLLEKLRFNSTHGLPIHPTVLAAEVRETLTENFQEWLEGLSAEQVFKASEKFPEFRKAFVKMYAESKGAKSTAKPPAKTEAKPEPKKRGGMAEVLRLNEAMKRGIG